MPRYIYNETMLRMMMVSKKKLKKLVMISDVGKKAKKDI